jgi:hypothetical protein
MPRTLYIAGYGRSGSTVLATVLGNHPEIASIGEACFLPDDWPNPGRVCACGRSYADCARWSGLHDIMGDPSALHRLRRVETIRGFPRLLLGLTSSKDRQLYRSFHRSVLRHVRELSHKPIILDSSKSAWLSMGRALALDRIAGEEVFVLHLVRDGRATLRSLLLTGSNWQMEGHSARSILPGIRAVVGWLGANLGASLMRYRLGKKRYLRVRYEDFLDHPEQELSRIGEFIDVEVDDLVARLRRGERFEVDHMVGGNRVRFERAVAVTRSPAAGAQGTLDRRHRLLFALLGRWLNVRYGYGGG